MAIYVVIRSAIGLYLYSRSVGVDITSPLYGVPLHRVGLDISMHSILAAWVIPFALGLMLIGLRDKVVWVAVLLFTSFFVLLSAKRSSQIALMITLPLMMAYPRAQRKTIGAALILIFVGTVIFVVLVNPGIFERYEDFRSLDRFLETQAERLDAWRSSIEMMRDYPVGVGFGGYSYRILEDSNLTGFFSEIFGTLRDPHHFFLYYGTAAGVGSLLCLLGIVLKTVFAGLAMVRESKHWRTQILGASLLWGFLTFIILGLLGGGGYYLVYLPKHFDKIQMVRFMAWDTGMFFWLTAGLLFGMQRISDTPQGLE